MSEEVAVDWVEMAVRNGQLIHTDDVLDDDPDSPTCGEYFATYRSTSPNP